MGHDTVIYFRFELSIREIIVLDVEVIKKDKPIKEKKVKDKKNFDKRPKVQNINPRKR